MNTALTENRLAGDIVQLATIRRGLVIEYLLYESPRVRAQWATTVLQFDDTLRPFDFGDDRKQRLVADINIDRRVAQDAFEELQKISGSSALALNQREFLVRKMLLNSSRVIAWAYQLEDLTQKELAVVEKHIILVAVAWAVLMPMGWLLFMNALKKGRYL